jgi:hypothetical protein
MATKLSNKQVGIWFANARCRRHSADNARKRKTPDAESKPSIKAQSDDGEDTPAFISSSLSLSLSCSFFRTLLTVSYLCLDSSRLCLCKILSCIFFPLHHRHRYGNVYILKSFFSIRVRSLFRDFYLVLFGLSVNEVTPMQQPVAQMQQQALIERWNVQF